MTYSNRWRHYTTLTAHSSPVTRGSFCHKLISLIGCIRLIYILDDTCEPVIGWDLMIRLDMQVDCGAKRVCCAKESKEAVLMVGSSGMEAGNTTASPVSEGYRDSPVCTLPPEVSSFVACNPTLVSKGIGTLPGFQRHIKLAPNANPIAVKTHQVPYVVFNIFY